MNQSKINEVKFTILLNLFEFRINSKLFICLFIIKIVKLIAVSINHKKLTVRRRKYKT